MMCQKLTSGSQREHKTEGSLGISNITSCSLLPSI